MPEKNSNTSYDSVFEEKGVITAYPPNTPGEGNSNGQNSDALPVVKIHGGGLSDAASEGERILIEAGAEIYQRDRSLVRPVVREEEASKN